MTSLRVLAITSAALGLGIAGAAVVGAGRSGGSTHRAASAPAFIGASTSTSTTTTTSTSTSTSTTRTKATIGPAKAGPDLRNVPPSILSRAADARALERTPGEACRSPARSDATTCAPQRDAVEIRWDVGKDP